MRSVFNDVALTVLRTDQERKIVVLLVLDALATTEIAEQMRMSEAMVKSTILTIYRRAGLSGIDKPGSKRIKLGRMLGMYDTVAAQGTVHVRLTRRQWEISRMVAQGMSNPEIASHFGKGRQVMRNIVKEIFDRTGVWNRAELAVWYESHKPAEVACAQ